MFVIAKFCFRHLKNIYIKNIRFNIKIHTKMYNSQVLKWVNTMPRYLYVCTHIYIHR